MKTAMIIISVLTITAMAYGFNVERVRQVNENFLKCSSELGQSADNPTVEVFQCAIVKGGRVLDANGLYKKEDTLKIFEDIISDTSKLEQARNVFTKCYDEAIQNGSTGDEQTIKITTCSLPIIPLFDKPN
ncbi:PREDICTED: uncharacterized protein LOC106751225 [Dinoponera quadriceps]|uniref:Uncharacterized protein LOC106751225 n=1 Tax=Dinoponera quadriceps TaxID=609295 RepID=A0A6P3Y9E2_DINQU|nr:PREDICTED: uncharacterized protein LOC106751225 [Dinoponera quadriceps]